MRFRRLLAAVALIVTGALYPAVAASAAKTSSPSHRAALTHQISYNHYSLTNLGTVRGGVPVTLDDSPAWRPAR